MTKKWSLSDSGLQVYEGRKHIATVHYAGKPEVDINEAIENATIIRQAPQAVAELSALRAQKAELIAALEKCVDEIKFQFACRFDADVVKEWDIIAEQNKAVIDARAILAKYKE